LLDAALRVLARDGYAAARIEDIAAEAAVTRATFYLHFGSKSEVAQAVMDPSVDAAWNDMYRKLNALGDFSRDELRAWLSDVASWYEEHRDLNTVLTAALVQEPSFASPWFSTDQTAADHLTHYMAKHRQYPEVARLRITTLIQGLFLMLYLWKVGGVDVDEDQLLDALTDVWYAVLRDQVALEE
jgi:AcrR family transcriptional regulator